LEKHANFINVSSLKVITERRCHAKSTVFLAFVLMAIRNEALKLSMVTPAQGYNLNVPTLVA
jgi:hypothetical protein